MNPASHILENHRKLMAYVLGNWRVWVHKKPIAHGFMTLSCALTFLGSKYLASNKNGYRKMGRGGVRLETLQLHFSRLSIILYKKIFFIIKPSAHLEGTTSQRKKLTVLCSGECFPDAPVVKTTPAMQGAQPPPLGLEEPLQKERATHSSIPAWEILRTKETAGLQGMGLEELDTSERLNNNNTFTGARGCCLLTAWSMTVTRK